MDNVAKINYHFVPADYKTFDFKSLLEETEQNNGTILWHTGNNGGKRAHRFNVGDICYFYYSNLPDGTSRILLKGIVKESDTDKNCVGEGKFSYNENTKGFRVGSIEAVALLQPHKFDQHKLEVFYFGSENRPRQINQTQRYLSQPEYSALLVDLLADDDHTKLKGIIKYFDEFLKCFFSGKDHLKHTTFTMAKGVPYAESHHFVKKSYLDKHEDMRWLVNASNNLIRLCPTCHAQLHHGKAEDVVERLNMIYNENKAWYDEMLLPYAKESGYDSVLLWVFDIYNQERKKNNYELIKIEEFASHDCQCV